MKRILVVGAIVLVVLVSRVAEDGTSHAAIPKDSTYGMNVLVLKYFPLDQSGQNIDINVTGDVGGPYSEVRQHTIDVTANLQHDLERASSYHGYSDNNAPPALTYHTVNTIEYTQAFPIQCGTSNMPDYYKALTDNGICSYVTQQAVSEVWIWAYEGPGNLAISESKMSGPFGDISNSSRLNDMPYCGKTYRVYTFNYGRGTSEAMESWGHQNEAELDAVDSDFFRNKFQGPNYPQTLGVNGRCGSVHNPPNARFEYDRDNPTPQMSDCLDWTPDGLGTLTAIGCQTWGCANNSDADNASLNYMIWNWQNLPGINNTKSYQGRPVRNLWDVHGDFDGTMTNSPTIFSDQPTPTPTPSPTPTPTLIWGDPDCNGSVAPRDGQALLNHFLGQTELSQTLPCPAVGATVIIDGVSYMWGDIDCSGSVAPRDGQAIVNHFLGQTELSQTQPCSTVGSAVQVVY